MKKILFFLLIIASASCTKKLNIPEDVKWEITKEIPNPNLSKNNIELTLNKKSIKKFFKRLQ